MSLQVQPSHVKLGLEHGLDACEDRLEDRFAEGAGRECLTCGLSGGRSMLVALRTVGSCCQFHLDSGVHGIPNETYGRASPFLGSLAVDMPVCTTLLTLWHGTHSFFCWADVTSPIRVSSSCLLFLSARTALTHFAKHSLNDTARQLQLA